jgi:hypothetical protein
MPGDELSDVLNSDRSGYRAKRVVVTAREEAVESGDFRITTGHLLLALLNELDGSAAECLEGIGLDLDTARAGVAALDNGLRPGHDIRPALTASTKRVLVRAAESSRKLRHRAVTTGHLLLGLLEESDSLGALVLSESGVNVRRFRRELHRFLRYDWSYGDDDWAPRTPPLVVAFAGERTVAHSASAVWALMEPIENTPLLYPDSKDGHHRADRMPGFPRGLGERITWTMTRSGAQRTDVTEYVEFEFERHLVSRLVTASAPTAYLQTALSLTPVGEETTTIRFEEQLLSTHPERRGLAAERARRTKTIDEMLAHVERLLDTRSDSSEQPGGVIAAK